MNQFEALEEAALGSLSITTCRNPPQHGMLFNSLRYRDNLKAPTQTTPSACPPAPAPC